MAEEAQELPRLTPVANPLNLVPVSLKEAALDSPAFRASTVHFGDQIDLVEKWLDTYVKAAVRLSNEFTSIESVINSYLTCLYPPIVVSEAVLDPDYTVLALKRYHEGSKEFWNATIKWMKRVETTVIDPIKAFITHDLASLKTLRRNLDLAQKAFDSVIARYASQSKAKEPSSLREDAFQLHEARKMYLKASMDFCVAAPQVKAALDKLLVKVFSDRWKEVKFSRDALTSSFNKCTADIERVRGWSREMENYERVFAKELQLGRKQIEEAAEQQVKPLRDLDTYSASTVPFISNSKGPLTPSSKPASTSEKQGWLFQKTLTGKPTRTVWVRRWFYVKNGVFGWLAQSPKWTSVEESEKIGVLLCGVRPATQEERRFCFEVKTKDSTIILQAETQAELMDWIAAFEIVKRNALGNSDNNNISSMQGPSFAISPPVASEFAAKVHEKEEDGPERSTSLHVDSSGLARASMDTRRPQGEGDSTTRIIQKLSKGGSMSNQTASGSASPAMGGIASLIAASHSALPISPQVPPPHLNLNTDFKKIMTTTIPTNSLAPSTLANPPVPTYMSKTAVIVGAEKGFALAGTGDGGLPAALMANLWGSTSWARLNKLERAEGDKNQLRSLSRAPSRTPSRASSPSPTAEKSEKDAAQQQFTKDSTELHPVMSAPAAPSTLHKNSVITALDLSTTRSSGPEEYPNYYPASLKMQDLQFRMLFPTNHHNDRLVMVFRATWNPSDQQEFPGRVYVTMNDVYFYSNHLGLVLISNVSLDSISEITAALGKDCDYLYIHLKEGVLLDGANRITVKTFLENQKLLQRRLDFLVRNKQSEESASIEEVIKSLIRMEAQPDDSPTLDGWDDIGADLPSDNYLPRKGQDLKTSLHIDGSLQPDPMKRSQKSITKFRLPSRPVEYTPKGFKTPVVERQYEITAKSLFHVLVGDKSAVFQILYCQRGANSLIQGPWLNAEDEPNRRVIRYEVQNSKRHFAVADYQVIDVINDHLCYVITERKTAWFLPMSNHFTMVLKIVITHVAKSHCKLSLFTRLDWSQTPFFGQALIEHQANAYLESYAMSLADIVSEQAGRLGVQGGTSARKAVNIFGQIGQTDQAVKLQASDLPPADMKSAKRMKYRPLPRMIMYAIRRFVIAYFFVIIGWIFQLAEWSIKTIKANKILLLALVASLAFNMFFSWKDSWAWWQERKAGNYMARLGVQPNTIMGRSIWLRDAEEFAVGNSMGLDVIPTQFGACSTAFTDLLSTLDASTSPSSYASNISLAAPTRTMLARVSHQRQTLGEHRHDLLVALRLVNRVEQDFLRAEWEGWVWREGSRCNHARRLLNNKEQDDPKGGALNGWWNEYCASCVNAMNKLQTVSTAPL